MRSFYYLALAILLLVACGSGEEPASTDTAPPVPTTTESPAVVDTPAVVEEPPVVETVTVVVPAEPISRSPKRIRFAKGSYSGMENGSVIGADVVDYVLRARADQLMTIHLSVTGSSAYFVVLDDGTDMSGPASNWTGELPVTGDYHVRVFLSEEDAAVGARASYSMVIEIR